MQHYLKTHCGFRDCRNLPRENLRFSGTGSIGCPEKLCDVFFVARIKHLIRHNFSTTVWTCLSLLCLLVFLYVCTSVGRLDFRVYIFSYRCLLLYA